MGEDKRMPAFKYYEEMGGSYTEFYLQKLA